MCIRDSCKPVATVSPSMATERTVCAQHSTTRTPLVDLSQRRGGGTRGGSCASLLQQANSPQSRFAHGCTADADDGAALRISREAVAHACAGHVVRGSLSPSHLAVQLVDRHVSRARPTLLPLNVGYM
eukprot:5195802-Prymnesium_polylepis.1